MKKLLKLLNVLALFIVFFFISFLNFGQEINIGDDMEFYYPYGNSFYTNAHTKSATAVNATFNVRLLFYNYADNSTNRTKVINALNTAGFQLGVSFVLSGHEYRTGSPNINANAYGTWNSSLGSFVLPYPTEYVVMIQGGAGGGRGAVGMPCFTVGSDLLEDYPNLLAEICAHEMGHNFSLMHLRYGTKYNDPDCTERGELYENSCNPITYAGLVQYPEFANNTRTDTRTGLANGVACGDFCMDTPANPSKWSTHPTDEY